MSERKNLLFAVVLVIIIFAVALAFVAHSETKAPQDVTAASIGYIDLNQLHEKFPDFARLQDLKTAYDTELNTFANYQRQTAATYLAELEKKKDEELAGKTDAEKQEIERKYDKMAQDKATEVNQAIQAKMRELQVKLDTELAKADDRLRQTITTVGSEKGLNLVVAKTAVYYGGTDVTNDVLAKANKSAGQTK